MQQSELFLGYKRDQQRRGHVADSVTRRLRSVGEFATWIEPKSLLTADAPTIEEWLDSKHIGSRTRYWLVSNLSSFYRWCILEDLLDANPCDRVVRPKMRRLLPRPIPESDLRRALSAAQPRMRAWLCLAAYTGLRAKEIALLDRADVLDHQEPPVIVVTSGKGGHQRIVPMHHEVVEALHAFGLPANGPVFPGRRGPMKPLSVTRAISEFLHRIGVHATAHNGRHYFATEVYRRSNHDLRLTQELMGHADCGTTAKYAAWDQTAAAGVVEQIGGDAA